jgi:hypothetical protein
LAVGALTCNFPGVQLENIDLDEGNVSITMVMFGVRIMGIDIRHTSEFLTVGWKYRNKSIGMQL